MELAAVLGLAAAVFVGASTQRISGMGFALVSSPFLVMVLGPHEGVMLVNLLGACSSLLIFAQVFRQVEYKKVLILLIPAMLMTLPGAWVAAALDGPLLSVSISIMVILALASSFMIRNLPMAQSKSLAVGAGAVSGFMSVTAGVSGPAIAGYAIASRWPQAQFAISVQLYFLVLSLTSLAAKGGMPQLHWQQWAGCFAAMVVGILLGNFLAPKIPAKYSRAFVVLIAFSGAVSLMVNGFMAL
ncbi:sulfite exporter TauE/SafE family protein [Glutamicibacter arilaitensis]|uniref:Probable membrane transporter protein n=1 Tax=Glutamicibacter arilaitensis TaxID=256701 RepID=A0A4Y8TW50_9MICC|nr:sulfite exporter TauE/SafE family protein [Glutamicibacter arilaitensis]TFH56048.1 sulfite exporter TauE/SafE family protein [Glutamicibacter arilaitensis]